MSAVSRLALAAVVMISALSPSVIGAARAEVGIDGQRAIRVAGDGTRFVAFVDPDGANKVYDSRAGSVARVQGVDGCFPTDVGWGRVLFLCQTAGTDGEDVSSSRLASVRGGGSWALPGARDGEAFDRIGRFWVEGGPAEPSRDCPRHLFLNWRTGQREWRVCKNVVGMSLSHRRLKKDPLPRTGIRADDMSVVAFDRRAVISDDAERLHLWRQGRGPVRLGRSIGACCLRSLNLTLSRGLATWAKGRTLHQVDVSTSRRWKRRLPQRRTYATPVRGGVVLRVPTGFTAEGDRVYELKRIAFGRKGR